MIPVLQDKFTPAGIDSVENLSGGQRGNCLQACVASIFELPLNAVPHFVSRDNWWGEFTKWLSKYNIQVMQLKIQPWNCWSIAIGKSPRGGFTHGVVCAPDGTLAHDPHPDSTYLDGEIQGYYIFMVKDPSIQPWQYQGEWLQKQ